MIRKYWLLALNFRLFEVGHFDNFSSNYTLLLCALDLIRWHNFFFFSIEGATQNINSLVTTVSHLLPLIFEIQLRKMKICEKSSSPQWTKSFTCPKTTFFSYPNCFDSNYNGENQNTGQRRGDSNKAGNFPNSKKTKTKVVEPMILAGICFVLFVHVFALQFPSYLI